MEPNLTYVYPHTRIQSLVSILRTTVYHAFPVVTENRDNEKDFMKGNILISNNIRFKVVQHSSDHMMALTDRCLCLRSSVLDYVTKTPLVSHVNMSMRSFICHWINTLKLTYVCVCVQKSSVLTRAGEQRRRCQSMKSYPSSELRNVCDERVSEETAEEGQDILQQMLDRRSAPVTRTRVSITLYIKIQVTDSANPCMLGVPNAVFVC